MARDLRLAPKCFLQMQIIVKSNSESHRSGGWGSWSGGAEGWGWSALLR